MWRLQRLSRPLTLASWEGTIPPGCCFTLQIPNMLLSYLFLESLMINKHHRLFFFFCSHFLSIHDATQIMDFGCIVCFLFWLYTQNVFFSTSCFFNLVPNKEWKGYAVSCSGAEYLTSSGQIHYHRQQKWITVSGIRQTYKNAFRCLS